MEAIYQNEPIYAIPIFDERSTKSEGVFGIVLRAREWTLLCCSMIALSIELSLRMTDHFTGHTIRLFWEYLFLWLWSI